MGERVIVFETATVRRADDVVHITLFAARAFDGRLVPKATLECSPDTAKALADALR